MQSNTQPWQPTRQRIFILPSRAGLGFAVLLLVMWLGAINYNNSLAHMLTFLLAALLVVAMVHSVRNLRDIDVRVQGAVPVFAGEPVPLQLDLITNGRPRYQWQIAVHQLPSQSRNPFKWMRGFRFLQTIAAVNTQRQFVTVHIPPHSRGKHAIARLRLASRFPLGLFYSWRYFVVDSEFYVYPQPAGEQALPFHHGGDDQGAVATHISGGEDFAGLKDFRTGEPLHGIAWKSLAKDDVMRSKQFQGHTSPVLWFDWQQPAVNDNEARISQLARWIVDAHANGLRYGLALPSESIAANTGNAHYHHCLSALARLPHD